jgi:signal transduction histidine kinase
VITLKRRVRAQAGVIGEKVQRETVWEERTRLAREFHDTLEQALVGIGMQLDVARNLLSSCPVPKGSLDTLDMARSMVRHSHEEARRSVWNLRPSALEHGDLPAALSEVKGQIKNGSPVEIVLEICGEPCPLPSRVELHLLRIGQEAATNAVKHARCKSIHLALHYAPQLVRLSIQDDGSGFNAEDATSSEAGHFGLLGMRERAEKIGGTLTILSRPGSGTRIDVTVPLRTRTGRDHFEDAR